MTDLTVQQAGQIVAAVYRQATGQAVPAPLDLSSYISVATTAVKYGYDVLMNAITQMWGETLFAVRPYTGAFVDMEFDTTVWGNADRKISYASRIPGTNEAYDYPVTYDATETENPTGDNLAVDMFKINKDRIVQTVFYGRSTWQYHRTRFLDQLETAFRSPAELVRYNAAAVQALTNDREGWAESMRRGVMVNALGYLAYEGRSINLLTEYNDATGLELTATTVRQPANYAPFMRWVYGRLGEIRDRMRENNTMFTTQFSSLASEGYHILRHTPDDRLKIKMLSSELHHLRASVLSTTYNADYLSLDGIESVAYWQYPTAPDTVQVKPVYMEADGSEDQPDDAITQDAIIGIMYDRDFMGCTRIRSKQYTTPFNAAGEYWNDYYKEDYKTRFDPTEKAVILLLA